MFLKELIYNKWDYYEQQKQHFFYNASDIYAGTSPTRSLPVAESVPVIDDPLIENNGAFGQVSELFTSFNYNVDGIEERDQ